MNSYDRCGSIAVHDGYGDVRNIHPDDTCAAWTTIKRDEVLINEDARPTCKKGGRATLVNVRYTPKLEEHLHKSRKLA